MVEESISIKLVKIEKATGAFIERRTYKCSCGEETTEIIQHLLKEHHLTIGKASKIAASAKQPVGAWT
ncbi:MAG: hypothetical protein LYZ66_02850 [Nitrososphaerales archaeon]|nr:hypothetical protein [Nitrososphaerales archaeon]